MESKEQKKKSKSVPYTPEFYLKYKESIQRSQAKYREKNKLKIAKKNLERYHNMSEEEKNRTLRLMREYSNKRNRLKKKKKP